MELIIDIEKQDKKAVSKQKLMDLLSIEGVDKVIENKCPDENLVFGATKNKWGEINPLLELRGQFNPSRVYEVVTSNKYSILKSVLINR